MIFIMFKRHSKPCSKIEIFWFLLVHWVAKKTVKQIKKSRNSRPEVFCNKGVLKNFAKLTGKHLCWNLS